MIKQKPKNKELSLIPKEIVISKIYYIRGKKVMFDRDLAELYGVEVRTLNQAVKRNSRRFPDDFMFQLNKQEWEILRSQIVISSYANKNLRHQIGTSSWGGQRYLPCVFTEQGVAMLSSVLNSERAIQVNIQIIRIFTKLREMLMTHKELKKKIEKLEKKIDDKLGVHDKQIRIILETIKLLLKEDGKPKEKIGFMIK
jgi:phage regulator Rha-like protein